MVEKDKAVNIAMYLMGSRSDEDLSSSLEELNIEDAVFILNLLCNNVIKKTEFLARGGASGRDALYLRTVRGLVGRCSSLLSGEPHKDPEVMEILEAKW